MQQHPKKTMVQIIIIFALFPFSLCARSHHACGRADGKFTCLVIFTLHAVLTRVHSRESVVLLFPFLLSFGISLIHIGRRLSHAKAFGVMPQMKFLDMENVLLRGRVCSIRTHTGPIRFSCKIHTLKENLTYVRFQNFPVQYGTVMVSIALPRNCLEHIALAYFGVLGQEFDSLGFDHG